MAVTEAGIASSALRLVGAQPISSLNDDNDRARICRQFYEETVREVTSRAPWGFAKARTSLAQLLAAPSWGFDHAYQLPAGVTRILETDIPLGTPWQREGDTLITDADSVSILYIMRVTDPNLWPDYFVPCVIRLLAAKVAYPIAKSEKLAEQQHAIYEDLLADAMSYDGQEGTQDQIVNEDLNLPRLE